MAAPQLSATDAFIQRWQGVEASELATAQSFFLELCRLLGVQEPAHQPEYQFERPITFVHGDGTTSPGRIDCYLRGHFVWESKKIKDGERQAAAGLRRFDEALLRARQQAEDYARALPAAEGRPPILVVVDVGHVIELYAEFSRSGATYTPFPDPRSHRIRLQQLADPAIRDRLRALWTDPMSLDPSRVSAKVTRAVSVQLAELARSLEANGHKPQRVAGFLTRCLFSMFAEDVGLLPPAPDGRGTFVHLLATYREKPDTLTRMLRVFWAGMDKGGFNAAIANDVLRFNGKLFKGSNDDGYVLPLDRAQIDGLLQAARANWREVEPAIFGTLLERALEPAERHALGAHYTPRAYVERLVLPTVIEPLRADWANAQAAAVVLAREADDLKGRKREAKLEEAKKELRRFHHQLCTTRVLDPACGSGNFLYVTLEHLKRLEGEVLNQLEALGESQDKLNLEGETVTLQQLRGIEISERAAAVAELVLWIGWLQWHVRTRGLGGVAEPVVHDYGNIECRDAVLLYDSQEPTRDAAGALVTRWDGRTYKPHPVTGEPMPDETALVPQWRYLNPRHAIWPKADFIVGNPPFLGKGKVREALGDGYIEALRSTWRDVPDSADFVMYWWHRAADLVRAGAVRRFGLITTNSIRQAFNRRLLAHHFNASPEFGLAFAVPDHPWVDSADGAAVRISMTVGALAVEGRLSEVVKEWDEGDAKAVLLSDRRGRVTVDLRIGGSVALAGKLQANELLASTGFILGSRGFVVDESQADSWRAAGLGSMLHPLRNGEDLLNRPRAQFVIDVNGFDEDGLRSKAPTLWQWLHERVFPERQMNRDPRLRQQWWRYRRSSEQLRAANAGLNRFIVTVETAKHRLFMFLPAEIYPEHVLIAIGSADALVLGILSSSTHVAWALAAGGTLEDRPRYNKTRCFEAFPFPSEDSGLQATLADRIRTLAEQLDAHRKIRQAAHTDLTLTGMYNVLSKLRAGAPLSVPERTIHDRGLIAVLRSLHDDLDAAVLAAYGWEDLRPALGDHTPAGADARAAAVEALLDRLVAVNARRAAEEASGTIRWLRPEFQDPARRRAVAVAEQVELEGMDEATAAAKSGKLKGAGKGITAVPVSKRLPWPAELPTQVKAVAEVLQGSPGPLTEAALAERFTGRGPWKRRLPQILTTLEAVGRARSTAEGWRG